MQPVGRLFQKFPRLVRELAKDLGKDVELMIEGAETEVDRVVVDSLYDPLVHMLRNALDHGVEVAEDRAADRQAGQGLHPAQSLAGSQQRHDRAAGRRQGHGPGQAAHEGDAKGPDLRDQAQPSDEEAFQLVFLPGFSTKEVASSVSGRGVGMDVVKTAVEKNRGAIRIESSLGEGTKFTIRLPIELSIVPTMLVSTSGAALALPMAVVQRVVELPETFMRSRRRAGAEATRAVRCRCVRWRLSLGYEAVHGEASASSSPHRSPTSSRWKRWTARPTW